MSTKKPRPNLELNLDIINKDDTNEDNTNEDNTSKDNITGSYDTELKCHSNNEIEKHIVNEKLKLFEDKIKTITDKCKKYGDPTNTNGSTGTIFDTLHGYIKFSDLPSETSKLFNKSDINCSTLGMKITTSINENENSIKFAELRQIFPLNIMEIYLTTQCKNDYGTFSNIINMEKIEGITLGNFLEELDLDTDEGKYKLVCCLIQLIYIMIYANLNGYVHNDLTPSNVIVYDTNEQFDLDKLKINDKNIKISFKYNRIPIPVIKLIDFSYSRYIGLTQLYNKFIFGESIQAIKMIINKLSILGKNCPLLEEINSLMTDEEVMSDELSNCFIEIEIDKYTYT